MLQRYFGGQKSEILRFQYSFKAYELLAYSFLGISPELVFNQLCIRKTETAMHSEKDTPYVSSDRMRWLIRNDSSLLMVMSRFGIALGFGEKTVREVCQEQGIDIDTFLTVANFISGRKYDYNDVSLSSLMSYLKQAHSYFLDYRLPAIRQRILEAIDCSGTDDLAFLILKFYDEYVTEVRRHMAYENEIVFSYVDGLICGVPGKEFTIGDFSRRHNHIESKLKELKDIIIRYYPQKDNNLFCSALYDIINCEEDLNSHRLVEDMIFIPAVEGLENNIKEKGEVSPEWEENELAEDKTDILSQREKEIIVCVAKGLSNKAIADTLNISVNTVTTHRRNISSKLQIHTQSGLTIYAIVNELITMDELRCITEQGR